MNRRAFISSLAVAPFVAAIVKTFTPPDHTAYIQSLIDRGGVVFLPAGTYRVTQPLLFRNVKVLGAPDFGTKFLVDRDKGFYIHEASRDSELIGLFIQGV